VVSLLIDTGDTTYFALHHELFEKLMEAGQIEKYPELIQEAGVAGVVRRRSGCFTRGELLGVPLGGCAVFDSGNGDRIGMSFLMCFNFTVDFQRNRFYFSKTEAGRPINVHACLGMSFRYEDGHCYVSHVKEDSEAALSPAILSGDEVKKLGALHEQELNSFSIYSMCQNNWGKPITVELIQHGHPMTKTINILYSPTH
jgi:hypothetical protein